ncbi:hypothetical protein [uncultured Neptuniibacter sp.]|uniref:hypothetical protein n=1 Tax=uncultured Neptuniibacter sp. TaxID=502143 RepID=UPI00261AB1ED|nr:hypothetical protein [uncultured Neptuniibacter sp.]
MLKYLTSLLFIVACPITYGAPLPADPTRPVAGYQNNLVVKAAESYQVSWLRVAKTASRAVVNGQRVSVGDSVDGAKVITISRDGVTLMIGAQQKLIPLLQNVGFSKVKSGK